MSFYDEPVQKVLAGLGTSEHGLSHAAAQGRLRTYGPNELIQPPPIRWIVLLLKQFASPVVWVLIGAVVMVSFLGQRFDAYVIEIIIILNAALGFFQERKSERAITALHKTLSLKATVLRDGTWTVVDAREVVPGDIMLLESGMKIPADGRIIWESSLSTQEAPVTGESTPVHKTSTTLHGEKAIGDRVNMVLYGTIVTTGRAKAVVVATGMHTQIGAIANLLRQTPEEETPLQKKLAQLGGWLTLIVLLVALAVFAAGVLKGTPLLDIFLASVALAVAAIPEGLPAIVTLALATGVQKMARRNALVRRLPSVQTLGACTVICTDKTGTLTHDQMTVRELYVPHKTLAVSGAGYGPQGTIDGTAKDYAMLLRIGALCNNATLQHDMAVTVVGDPTEGALLVSAIKGGIDTTVAATEEPRIAEVQFSSERKRMTTIHRSGTRRTAYIKGAPDIVVGRCTRIMVGTRVRTMTTLDRKDILRANDAMATRAMRVLAFAYRPLDVDHHADESVEKDLIFAGLQGMIDPPRDEAAEAVATAQRAGIRVVMITGDHPLTAQAIANELGIKGDMMSGKQLGKIHDLDSVIDSIGIFARVDPAHKLRIIEALRKKGHIVAMTGDGVNDAPALKSADIGIAMGKSGTDVAREASDMVLADDNFATIIEAVRGGRSIFDNIVKFVTYMMSTNLGEVLAVLGGIILGLPLIVSAIMLLWINLVTDGLPAIALSMERPEPDTMQRKPRPVNEGIITRRRLLRILAIGIVMGILSILLFYWRLPAGVAQARTMAFTTMVFLQMAIVINQRSDRVTIGDLGWFSNRLLIVSVLLSILLQVALVNWPPLQRVFGTVPLPPFAWVAAAGAALLMFGFARALVRITSTRE